MGTFSQVNSRNINHFSFFFCFLLYSFNIFALFFVQIRKIRIFFFRIDKNKLTFVRKMKRNEKKYSLFLHICIIFKRKNPQKLFLWKKSSFFLWKNHDKEWFFLYFVLFFIQKHVYPCIQKSSTSHINLIFYHHSSGV